MLLFFPPVLFMSAVFAAVAVFAFRMTESRDARHRLGLCAALLVAFSPAGVIVVDKGGTFAPALGLLSLGVILSAVALAVPPYFEEGAAGGFCRGAGLLGLPLLLLFVS